MGKKIRIECTGATALPLADFSDFQGNLKSLHKDQYEKLRKHILEEGFSSPVLIWKNGEKYNILDGHQRLRTVRTMVEEDGYTVGNIPIAFVNARNEEEAKRKVLSFTSQFGKMERDGLYEFLHGTDISQEELVGDFNFPEVDLPKFVEEYYNDQEPDPLDIGEGDQLEADLDQGKVHSAHVKMVQLFFNDQNHDAFIRKSSELQEVFGTDNLTDTVMKAIEFAYEENLS